MYSQEITSKKQQQRIPSAQSSWNPHQYPPYSRPRWPFCSFGQIAGDGKRKMIRPCGYCGHTEYDFRWYQHSPFPATEGCFAVTEYPPPTALRVSNTLFALCTGRCAIHSMPSVPRLGESVGTASTVQNFFPAAFPPSGSLG